MIITTPQARAVWHLLHGHEHHESWATVRALIARGILDTPRRLSYRGRLLALAIHAESPSTPPRCAWQWDGRHARRWDTSASTQEPTP
jgi:hypothetical protein